MLFTTYGITHIFGKMQIISGSIRFWSGFIWPDKVRSALIRSDPVRSSCSIYKWFRPFRTVFNLIIFLNCNFNKVAYRLEQTWTHCKFKIFLENWAELRSQIPSSIQLGKRSQFWSGRPKGMKRTVLKVNGRAEEDGLELNGTVIWTEMDFPERPVFVL